MHTITLYVENNKLDDMVTILNNLKQDLIKNFTINDDGLKEYQKSEKFKQDKKRFTNILKNIESENETLYNQTEFNKIINEHLQNLENASI